MREEKTYSTEEVLRFFETTRTTLHKWRKAGFFPGTFHTGNGQRSSLAFFHTEIREKLEGDMKAAKYEYDLKRKRLESFDNYSNGRNS